MHGSVSNRRCCVSASSSPIRGKKVKRVLRDVVCCVVVKDLFLWRDVKKSGIAFGSSFIVLLSLALCSIISVVAYLSLVVLTMTASYRVYHLIMATVKKTEATNPYTYVVKLNDQRCNSSRLAPATIAAVNERFSLCDIKLKTTTGSHVTVSCRNVRHTECVGPK